MHERLSLAVWERPGWLAQPLGEVEVAIIRRWMPPLNIRDNPRPLPRLRLAREDMTREASGSQAEEASACPEAVPAAEPPSSWSTLTPSAAPGRTPVELARELGKSPKTVRQALRDKYGKLAVVGGHWGVLTPEQEAYLRERFR